MHGLAIGLYGVLTHALDRVKSSGISKGETEAWSVSERFWLRANLALSSQPWKDTISLFQRGVVADIGVDGLMAYVDIA